MWSLPDINVLNARAAERQGEYERMIDTGLDSDGEAIPCEYSGTDCEGRVYVRPWYDIFSDDVKGILALCEHHDHYYGSPAEGYFTCDTCNRVFIENYTWEMYAHYGYSESLCLNCYREQALAEESSWIDLTTLDTGEFFTEKFFNHYVKRAKHLIAVGQPTPDGLEFLGNVEFDSLTGASISGLASDIRNMLVKARADGYTRAILILDAAYQFAVSVGVYVPLWGSEYDMAPDNSADIDCEVTK